MIESSKSQVAHPAIRLGREDVEELDQAHLPV